MRLDAAIGLRYASAIARRRPVPACSGEPVDFLPLLERWRAWAALRESREPGKFTMTYLAPIANQNRRKIILLTTGETRFDFHAKSVELAMIMIAGACKPSSKSAK